MTTQATGWGIYLKERFPMPVYLLLSAGIALSGQWLASGDFEPTGFSLAMLGLLLFFSELRLMDELKDYDKDLIAHPDRPLPRGAIGVSQVQKGILLQYLTMIAFAALVGFLVNGPAGFLYLITALYLWLMYKEFYAGPKLSEFPLVYAVSHQIILLPLCAFAVTISRPGLLLDTATWAYGTCALGAFFTYEVCRKLDPQAHPVLRTYLAVYGMGRTAAILITTSAVAWAGARGLGIQARLIPFEAVVPVAFLLIFRLKPSAYKAVEALATLSLLLHLYAGVIQRFFPGVAS